MPTKKTKRAQKKRRAHQKKRSAKKKDREPESAIVASGDESPKFAAPISTDTALVFGDPRARNVTVIDARENPAFGVLAVLPMIRLLSEARRANRARASIEPRGRESEVAEP